MNRSYIYTLTLACLLSALIPSVALGLIIGLIVAIFLPNRLDGSKPAKMLLQVSVVLLGFGLKFNSVLELGFQSIGLTFFSIFLTLVLGWILGKALKVESQLSDLIAGGTAICGGSAIAAISAAINAPVIYTAISLAIVFGLNAIALVIFPYIGNMVGLNEIQFGMWAAIAIHDTSSVVGACTVFGAQALFYGTTIKLVRALWILPVSFFYAKKTGTKSKAKFPLFLIGFLMAALFRQGFVEYSAYFDHASYIGKRLMVGTLFLIGTGLSLENLKQVGFKPLLQAVVLWVFVGAASLAYVLNFH
jgi:uncharacterized integral membrane protein (TIGR00698 family)